VVKVGPYHEPDSPPEANKDKWYITPRIPEVDVSEAFPTFSFYLVVIPSSHEALMEELHKVCLAIGDGPMSPGQHMSMEISRPVARKLTSVQ
jgi:hypothetical protein